MKKSVLNILTGVALLVSASLASAQATLSSTTLGSAVTDTSSTTISVASATGITASNPATLLYVDDEAMCVNGLSGTLIQVQRGCSGTRARTHASGATVYLGPPRYFTLGYSGFNKAGSCTSANEVVLPFTNVTTGDQYQCVNSVWEISNFMPWYSASFTGGATTGSADIFPFTDTTLNTGTGNVVSIKTGAGSSEKGLAVACGAQSSSATPANGAACYSLISGAGGASTAAGTAGGNGGSSALNTGAGGAGASTGTGGNGGELDVLSGAGGAAAGAAATGGNGGLIKVLAGNGAGTITGGNGGAVTVTAGNGANGSTAGGTGGAVTIATGAAGSGGTGTVGALLLKQGADTVLNCTTAEACTLQANGTNQAMTVKSSGTGAISVAQGSNNILTSTAAGATTVSSNGTNQTTTIQGSGSGKVTIADGTDTTKKVVFDPSGNSTGIAETFAFGATSARTATFPDASITVPGVVLLTCGSSAACSPTTVSSTVRIVTGSCPLVSASPSTCSVSGISPAFTSNTSYNCTATPEGTTAAIAAAGIAVNKTSGSAFTLTGPNTVTTVVDWTCVGT